MYHRNITRTTGIQHSKYHTTFYVELCDYSFILRVDGQVSLIRGSTSWHMMMNVDNLEWHHIHNLTQITVNKHYFCSVRHLVTVAKIVSFCIKSTTRCLHLCSYVCCVSQVNYIGTIRLSSYYRKSTSGFTFQKSEIIIVRIVEHTMQTEECRAKLS